MIGIVILGILAVIEIGILNRKITKLENELEIKKFENKNLKMVLAENDLIPKEFVK